MAEFYQENTEFNFKKIGPVAFIVGGLLLVFILWSKLTVTIGPGEGGVLFETLGSGINTEKTYGEGFHVIAPWNKMIVRKVRQQSISDEMNVLSVNGLEVKVNGTIWYEPEFENLGFLIKTKGEDYERELLDPAINAAARSVVGRYTPEQLYSSKRDVIEQEILEEVQAVLKDQFLLVKRVLVEDVKLPSTIVTAIETKLKQEQESLEYEFRLAKAKKEAERQRIEAGGKAAANDIISKSLTDKILKEKGILATLELAKSPNSKVVVVGSGKDGLPLILGGSN
jgi:prohibitin 2|tara:strand:+ start:239 stop:1087 length:849 start_codon:yes stop_codon:yes gene_type:complete